jgi:TonB family protein
VVPASAQTTLEERFKDANIYYLDKFEQPADVKDSVAFVRIVQRDSSAQDLFTVQDFYLDGSRRLVGESRSSKYYLNREGVFIEYFRNGKRKSIKTYENGTENGDEVYFYPNGKSYYTNHIDSALGQWIIAQASDSTGVALARDGNGTCVLYDDDFKLIKGKGPLVNGFREGEWSGNVNDTATYVCTYAKGRCISGTSTAKSGRKYEFKTELKQPEFDGGEQGFARFLARTVHYPAAAKEHNIQGRVFAIFVVNREGTLSNVRIVKGIGSGCDEEVLRVLRLSPRWTPGSEYGIPANILYTIPVSFTLQGEGH